MMSQIQPKEKYAFNDSPILASAIVTIWISRNVKNGEKSVWLLDKVFSQANNFTQSLKYKDSVDAQNTFDQDFWKNLASYLPADVDEHVLTASDFAISLPQLVLARMRVTGFKIREGAQKVSITFTRTIGDLSSIFRPGRAPSLIKEAECGIATRAVVDLLLPVLELLDSKVNWDDFQTAEKVKAGLNRIRKNRFDLELYSALITRFISQSDQDFAQDVHPKIEKRQNTLNYALI